MFFDSLLRRLPLTVRHRQWTRANRKATVYLDCNLGAGAEACVGDAQGSRRPAGIASGNRAYFSVLRPAPPAALLRNGEKGARKLPGICNNLSRSAFRSAALRRFPRHGVYDQIRSCGSRRGEKACRYDRGNLCAHRGARRSALFIALRPKAAALAIAEGLQAAGPEGKPLFGVPFCGQGQYRRRGPCRRRPLVPPSP